MITANTTPLYLEEKIPDRLGVSRDDLKFVRRAILKKNCDWTILARNVVLTQSALDRVLEYLHKWSEVQVDGLDLADCQLPPAAVEKNHVAHSNGDLVTLTVRRQLPNYRLLIAVDARGQVVQVRVKTNKNFRPNMPIRAARLVRPGVYEMEGRCPRFPGRY